jgi:hypothetical protein
MATAMSQVVFEGHRGDGPARADIVLVEQATRAARLAIPVQVVRLIAVVRIDLIWMPV